MKNERERFRIGLILMALTLVTTVVEAALWLRTGRMVDALLIIFNIVLFIYGVILTIQKGKP
jgi:drug/metabolite transporter superfamily protein YnfA